MAPRRGSHRVRCTVALERESWPALVYVRVRPAWIRYSDYTREPPEMVELDGDQLASLG
jgi:hypothetical protein